MTTNPLLAERDEALALLARDLEPYRGKTIGSLRIDMGEVQKILALLDALAAIPTPPTEQVEGRRFWIVLQEPRRRPERKGPWPERMLAEILRECIKARPTAYIHVLRVSEDGEPWIDHGPEELQIADGRSMSVGRRHNQRVRDAHAPVHAAIATLNGTPPSVHEDEERGAPCERCQGNGELVTDWDLYLGEGGKADDAVEPCPDCDGTGRDEAPASVGTGGEEAELDRLGVEHDAEIAAILDKPSPAPVEAPVEGVGEDDLWGELAAIAEFHPDRQISELCARALGEIERLTQARQQDGFGALLESCIAEIGFDEPFVVEQKDEFLGARLGTATGACTQVSAWLRTSKHPIAVAAREQDYQRGIEDAAKLADRRRSERETSAYEKRQVGLDDTHSSACASEAAHLADAIRAHEHLKGDTE